MEATELEQTRQLTAVAVACARAEASTWVAMLEYSDRLRATHAATENRHLRQLQNASISLEIAQAMQLSESQVHRRLAAGSTVRHQAPLVWMAFRGGSIDALRVIMISDAIGRLQRPESVSDLDLKVVGYAQTHTSAQLRTWLKKFIARVESDLFNERAEDERRKRYVAVDHGDDGMSYLTAYLPSHIAAAIDRRLNREAAAFRHDERTKAQRRADLAAAWLTTNENGEAAIGADIAVVLSAETLVGLSDAPAVASDGSFVVPAAWVLDSAAHPFWHKLLTDTSGNVLEHVFLGRFAPESLDKAIWFRDGTCQAPTCTKPAQNCDDDHQIPHPRGPTSGRNMWPLCRRHHLMKTHDVLRWILPSSTTVDAERVNHRATMDYARAGDTRITHIEFEYPAA